jgi:hypothetical protein
LEDVTNRAAIRMSKLQVHTTPGARVSEPSAMASPSCAKDDSAMGCVGPVEEGSESVSKPAGKRIVALSSPAAAMDFERAPEPFSGFFSRDADDASRDLRRRNEGLLLSLSSRALRRRWRLRVEDGDRRASPRVFARFGSDARRGGRQARRSNHAAHGLRQPRRRRRRRRVRLVLRCAFRTPRVDAFGMSLTYGVRMGGVPPQKTLFFFRGITNTRSASYRS